MARQIQRPPSIPKAPALPKGPRWEQRLRKQAKIVTGPGSIPEEFPGSLPEWIFFWDLCKILDPLREPRTPPYYGRDGLFRYQKAFEGGRDRGGSVIDFVVFPNAKIRFQIAVRIQGGYFHNESPQRTQSLDRVKKVRIAAVMGVVDVQDYDLLETDGTAGNGSKSIITAKRTLGLIESPNPVATGQVRNVTYGK